MCGQFFSQGAQLFQAYFYVRTDTTQPKIHTRNSGEEAAWDGAGDHTWSGGAGATIVRGLQAGERPACEPRFRWLA